MDVSASLDFFRKLTRDFLNMLCATTETQGFSVSEHLVGTDHGGPEGDPSMAPPASSARKRQPTELASSRAGTCS